MWPPGPSDLQAVTQQDDLPRSPERGSGEWGATKKNIPKHFVEQVTGHVGEIQKIQEWQGLYS